MVSKAVTLPPPPSGFVRFSTKTCSDLRFEQGIPSSMLHHYRLLRQMWKDPSLEKLECESDLIPFLVRRHYRSLVQVAIKKLKLLGAVLVCRRKHGPSVTINVKLASLTHAVNVDLCPIMETGLALPEESSFPHPSSLWPSPDIQKQTAKAGVNLTAHHDFEWRLSFINHEQIMLDHIDANGGCRKKVLRILKGLALDFWATSSKSALTSYHLKVDEIALAQRQI